MIMIRFYRYTCA